MPVPAEVYDGLTSVLGGMNASLDPSVDEFPKNQCARAINAIFRGGKPRNRPAFKKMSLTFADTNTQTRWNGGNVQCAAIYAYPGAPERIIISIGGQILRMTPQTDGSFYVESILPAGDQGNDPLKTRAFMCQSDKWFIVQDGTSIPLLIYGDTVRRASTTPGNSTASPPVTPVTYTEIPKGTFMAYGYGRTWICTGPREYKASDLIGERGATDSTGAQSGYEVVTFDDQDYLAENSSFLLPTKFGPVSGMAFVNQQDTATGQGPLIVFGRNGAEAVNASSDRSTWQTTQIQVEALTNIGAQGDQSIVNVNGDLFFRAADGWRSYKQARAEQGLWGSLPMSTAMRPYTDTEGTAQLFYSSAIFFNNRLIVTNAPQQVSTYIYHGGLMSLDFDPISTSLGVSVQPPAWDGVWVPPRHPAKLLAGRFLDTTRAFAVCTQLTTDSNGNVTGVSNTLDEILENHRLDDDTTPIVTTIVTRSLNFNSPFLEKEFLWLEASYSDRANSTSIAISYGNNGNMAFIPLKMGKTAETGPTLLLRNQLVVVGDGPHYTVDNRCDFPNTSANTSDPRLNTRFYRLQLNIVLTGSQTLDQIRVVANPLLENQRGGLT